MTDKYMFSQMNMTFIKRAIISLNTWEIYQNIPDVRREQLITQDQFTNFEEEINDHYEALDLELEFTIKKREQGQDKGLYEINYYFQWYESNTADGEPIGSKEKKVTKEQKAKEEAEFADLEKPMVDIGIRQITIICNEI